MDFVTFGDSNDNEDISSPVLYLKISKISGLPNSEFFKFQAADMFPITRHSQ